MELRQVRYFLAVADAGTFTAAADRLGIVQSAVSQQIARLEREVGTPLFDRSRRAPGLTAAGTRFLPAARALIVAEDAARRAARDGPEASRPLRLGVPGALFPATDGLAGVEIVSVASGQRQSWVSAGELDAAIVHGDDVRADLRSLPLPPDRVVAVVSQQHPLAERSRIAVDDLVSYPLIFAENALGSYLTRAVLRACRSAGFDAAVATVGAETGAVSAVRARPDSWSVFYAAQAALLRADELGVRFVPVVPALTVPTVLVFRADAERVGRQLVRALREK